MIHFPSVPASSEKTVIAIDTSVVGKGDDGGKNRVITGIFKTLASTIFQTYIIHTNEQRHTENNWRTMLPERHVAPRPSFAYETADNLLAFLDDLVETPDEAARGALLETDFSDWRKAHYHQG